jgi:hypothetical protein
MPVCGAAVNEFTSDIRNPESVMLLINIEFAEGWLKLFGFPNLGVCFVIDSGLDREFISLYSILNRPCPNWAE